MSSPTTASAEPFVATSGRVIRVIRRNRSVVAFDLGKITHALTKAFISLKADEAIIPEIVDQVRRRVEALTSAYLHVEQIQDIVVEELMKTAAERGGELFRVAASYVAYRAERASERAKNSSLPPAPAHEHIKVLMPNGDIVAWDEADLRERVRFSMAGLNPALSESEILNELRRSLFDGVTRADLDKTVLLNAKQLQQLDSDFSLFAGRFLLTYIYEEVLGWDILRDGVGKLSEFHRRKFRAYIERGVHIKRLSPRALEYNLDKLAAALDPTSDYDFDFLGIQTLYDRYLLIDKTGKNKVRLETPQFFWMRVAMGLFLQEKEDREDWVLHLYEMYRTRRFCSSTPTLFNSLTLHSQLSSCYLYYIDDSLEGIMQRGIAENAQLSKWAGGLGGSWTPVRGTGAYIAGTNGESQGVVPFLKLHNAQLVAVNQGGKRRGSGCAYLETWHSDITEFLELRRNTGDDRRRTHDMNTANWIPDLFMKRMEARLDWTLFHSNQVPDLHDLYGREFEERYVEYEKMAAEGKIFGYTIPALELWKKMLSMLFETGHPWITFKDPSNIANPQAHVGRIHSSNLCTEILLNTGKDETAVCNLGSIVLSSHISDDGKLDVLKLRDTVRIAMRALDNVIDINFYPTEAAQRSNLRHRPVGLGVMGLHDALHLKGLAFDSTEALDFNDEMMEAMAYFAYEASSDLAAEKGAYSTFNGSSWSRGILPPDNLDRIEAERGIPINVPRGGKLDWEPLRAKIAKQGMRNSNCLAIAPTATISSINGTSPCIEPLYKNLFVKSNLSGEFVVISHHLVRELKACGLWSVQMADKLKERDGELTDIPEIPESVKTRFKTAFDIDYKWVIDAAARRQKWIDQTQSLNLWLKTADLKVLSHMYRHLWATGARTSYYLRTLGASDIEKATISVKKEVRGVAATGTQDNGAAPPKKTYTADEKAACSIEAMRNGGTCTACE